MAGWSALIYQIAQTTDKSSQQEVPGELLVMLVRCRRNMQLKIASTMAKSLVQALLEVWLDMEMFCPLTTLAISQTAGAIQEVFAVSETAQTVIIPDQLLAELTLVELQTAVRSIQLISPWQILIILGICLQMKTHNMLVEL